MAIECMVWVLDQSENLSTSEKFVLLGIANHSKPDGTNSFPSLETLCKYTLLSKSSVQRAIKALVQKDYLEKESGGGRRSNTYRLKMDRNVVQLRAVEHGHGDHPDGSQRLPSIVKETTQPSQALTIEPSYNRNRTEIQPSKKRDEVWDAIMEAWWVNTKSLNSNERGRYNKAVKLLKESNATAQEIHMRVKVYRRKFKGAAVTPIAVANHWSELDPAVIAIEEVQNIPKGWDAIKQVREERERDS